MQNKPGNPCKGLKRIVSIQEKILRSFHKAKKETIAKCEELGIEWFEVGKNDSFLYAAPQNYVCILSTDEYAIGDNFAEGVPDESIFISLYDNETFNLY